MSRYYSLLLVSFLFLGCRKASEEIPAYIKSNSSKVISTNLGEPTSEIYGLHFSVETDDRGTWQFPFLAPVLKDGIKSVVIRPVVKKNNISTLFMEYPFYKIKVIDLNLIRGKEIDTQINFEYVDSISMLTNETMEIKTNFSSSERSVNAASGNYSMKLNVDMNTVDSTITSFYYKSLDMSPEKEVYMEFDYYMPNGILAPALSFTNSNGNIAVAYSENYLTPNSKWTHVYWYLSPVIRGQGLTQFTPVFLLTLEKGGSKSEAYIDNIRILEK